MKQILLCGVSALKYTIRCGASPAEEYAKEILTHWIEKITGEKKISLDKNILTVKNGAFFMELDLCDSIKVNLLKNRVLMI